MEIALKEISQRLAARADELAPQLLPGGRRENGEWVCGDIGGGPGKSLKLHLDGPHAGQWRDWATDEHGDLIDLIRETRNLSPGDAMKEARKILGIADPVQAWERKSYAKAPPKKTTAPTPQGRAENWLTRNRGLTRETIAELKIEIEPQAGAVVFPCYSPGGEIVNRSYRTLNEPKRVWQDKGCAPSLFGWQALSDRAYRERKIILAEGQIDAATWRQWGFEALSVPNGSGLSWVEYEWDNLEIFETVYLAFDQDEAGRKIAEATIQRLGRHRCLVVAMPKKDANDCLRAGYTSDDAAEWLAAAKAPKMDRLVTADEIVDRLEDDMAEKPVPPTLPFCNGDWQAGEGFWFRPAEVTIWGGYAGAGKSTMLNFFIKHLIAAELSVFIGSFEIPPQRSLRKIVQAAFGKDAGVDLAVKFARHVADRLSFADIVGSISSKELMEMLWFSHRRYGATHMFIDSLMRVQDLEENWPAQGEFANRLQDFAKETGSHVHLVAHLAKPGVGQRRPSMHGVKGSSLLVNNVDNVLLVTRNQEKDDARKRGGAMSFEERNLHDAELIVDKQRETGWMGVYRLDFDQDKLGFTAR